MDGLIFFFCIYSQALVLTRRWTWRDVTGPVDGSLARAVAPVVPRWRVVTETLGKLQATPTGP